MNTKPEWLRLVEALDNVLNGRCLCFLMEVASKGIPDEEQILTLLVGEEFDEHILRADMEQQEGDMFHDLVGPQKWEPRVNYFPRGIPDLKRLGMEAGREYLEGMLTCKLPGIFFSPYHVEWSTLAAQSIMDDFLFWATELEDFRLYQLDPEFIFDPKASEVDLHYWDRLGSDSITALASPGRVVFIFTNGSD